MKTQNMTQFINNILQEMTLKEKIALCSGKSFWETKDYPAYDIPSLFMCDGPHGLRKQENTTDMLGINRSKPATCFPTAVTTGASWDEALLERIGEAIGEEALANEVGLVLGPGANIKRDPLCGRNFEYFSEDPFISGKMAAAFIRGLQKNGTSASLKHFACNNQEYNRFTSDGILDERTLRELYLTAFEIAVKESKPDTVMSAYPKVNGTHCSDNKKLLTDILRTDWGFDGLVVTDWGGMNDRIEAFKAGCDLNMPGGSDYMEAEALESVQMGSLSEADIDACAARVLRLVFHTAGRHAAPFSTEAHHKLAAQAAEQGAVLLKNSDAILPLNPAQKVAFIGTMAKKPRYQGAGSSHINPTKLTAALDLLPDVLFSEGCDEQGNTNELMLADAAASAGRADIAVIFAGLPSRYESEGFDRDNLSMPSGHIRLIEAVSKANPNTVVVLHCGCVVECPWAEQVKGILYMGLAGQAGGNAVVNLLYGKVNPSGKLTESWPYSYQDCPTYSCYREPKNAQYREGLYVGYRYYDKAEVNLRWPFGYGLSYTTFAYSNLQITDNTVSASITNTGGRAGAEVAQLYIKPPTGGLHRPKKELKGFQKVFLQPGETQTVTFHLEDRSFAVWSHGWQLPSGTYTILVGSSSQQLPLSGTLYKKGVLLKAPDWQTGSWYENPMGTPSKEQWEQLLGQKYVEPILQKGHFTMDNSIMEMKDYSFVMKIMFKAVEFYISKGFGFKRDYNNPDFKMYIAASAGGPLRSMQISSGMKGGIFKGMLHMANGHFLKGLFTMISGK